jgi:hypothetical protein
MATFTLSQLDTKPGSYGILGTDLILQTAGTNTPFLSSIKATNNDYIHFLSQNFGSLSATSTSHTNYFAGNVGIGTTSPGYKLHAYRADSGIVAKVETGSSADAQIQFVNTSDSWQIGIRETDNFSFWNGSDLVHITPAGNLLVPSGNVGIGTAAPSSNADLTLEGGAVALKETTTPTADTNYGKVYTKSDNKLYFQDGAGTEHELAYA